MIIMGIEMNQYFFKLVHVTKEISRSEVVDISDVSIYIY
jgi:hypothetical protein